MHMSPSSQEFPVDSFCLLKNNYFNRVIFSFLWFAYAGLLITFTVRFLIKLLVAVCGFVQDKWIIVKLGIVQNNNFRGLSFVKYTILNSVS